MSHASSPAPSMLKQAARKRLGTARIFLCAVETSKLLSAAPTSLHDLVFDLQASGFKSQLGIFGEGCKSGAL